jgi:hypothetical protein
MHKHQKTMSFSGCGFLFDLMAIMVPSAGRRGDGMDIVQDC